MRINIKKDSLSENTINNMNKYLEDLKQLNNKTMKTKTMNKNESFHHGIKNLLNILQLNWIKNENPLKFSSIGFLNSKENLSVKKTHFMSTQNKIPLFTVNYFLFFEFSKIY